MVVTAMERLAAMENVDSATIQVVTPETASAWLELMHYDQQRQLRSAWAEFLAEEMRRGNFRQRTQIEIMHYDGKRILIDGQHRLWAVVLSGKPQIFTVVESYADSAEAVGWAYGNTDIGLRRSGSELYHALDLQGELGLTKTEVDRLSGAITFMMAECSRGRKIRPHRDDVVMRMRLYARYMQRYVEITEDCEASIRSAAMRAATLSAALLTLRFSVSYAERNGAPSVVEFWSGTIHDDGVRVGDPRKAARHHLLNTAMAGGGYGRRGRATATAPYSVRGIAACFNAYIQRRDLRLVKVLNEDAPLVLYGVPNDPAQWW